MFLVTEANHGQYPVPVGSIVKWARWTQLLPDSDDDWVYEVRCTEPLPVELRGVELPADDGTYFQILPIEMPADSDSPADAPREGVPQVFPYRTHRFGALRVNS